MRARRGVGLVATAALLGGSMLVSAAPAGVAAQAAAVEDHLPGGTNIGVTITAPPDRGSYAPGPVTVTGTASVGEGLPVADTALMYVLDVSGSTASPGCGGNQNNDEDSNTILDCEIKASIALNEAIEQGTIGEVGAAAFGERAATADARPRGGHQPVTGPATNDNQKDFPDVLDIEQVLTSARYGRIGVRDFEEPHEVGDGGTNFAAGIREIATVARETEMARTLVVFLSDGSANRGGSVTKPVNDLLADFPNVVIHTFAFGPTVGDVSPCDLDPSNLGSLSDIAALTHGTCTSVTDITSLPDILPRVIASKLTGLTMQVDGAAATPITEVTPALPQDGPKTVDYVASTPALAPGEHTICVTATGSDSGGTGDVTACHTITVRPTPEPPPPSIAVTIDIPTDGAERTAGPVAVAGTASIGPGTDLSDAALIYVLDVSGSTDFSNVVGCGDDPNEDKRFNRVLDCEIAAVQALNDRAVDDGTLTEVGAAVFGTEAATADVGPAAGEQLITGPAINADGTGGRDIMQVVASTFADERNQNKNASGIGKFTRKEVGPGTNFADGIRKAITVAGASGKTRKIVVFLSDGIATEGGSITEPLANVPSDVDIYTFAVGTGPNPDNPVSCSNTGQNGEGSLQQIADETGGICTPVANIADLPDKLPGILTSQLTSLTMQVDGEAAVPITIVTPVLPQPGPVQVSYSATTPPLTVGQHTICVTARGNDRAGNVSAAQCRTITVNPAEGPPVESSITVAIDTPADGAERTTGPVAVTGAASIGPGTGLSDAALIYVLDVSGSTDFSDVVGCGDDQNGDGRANRVLDCEIAAVTALNERSVRDGSLTEVGAAVFGTDAATADVGPARGEQFITGPDSDLDGVGGRDIEQVLTSAFADENSFSMDGSGIGNFTRKTVGGNTDFADGIRKAITVAGASGKKRKIVVFLSDGIATEGDNIAGPLADVPANVDIYTFAVGTGSSCGSTGNGDRGSLQQIADETGGTCTPVTDITSLPGILPGVITSELTSLTLQVDGAVTIPITDASPALPRQGPTTVNYLTKTPALAPGQHTVCVTATGHDGGRDVSATDCHTVTVKPAADRPPSSSIGVTIDTPANGAQLPAGQVTVTGTASIGAGTDLSDTALVYVLDVSGSTRSSGGCGDNQNNDDVANTILDCEIAAVKALNEQAVSNGRLTEAGAAVFGEFAVTADVGPANGEQLITGPASDLDRTGGRDIDQVLASAYSNADGQAGVGKFTKKEVGTSANFASAIQSATTVAGSSGKAHKIVAFLADGTATDGGSITELLANVAPNVDVFTFAVGGFSSCDDTGANGEGSLQQIANATGGTCTPVTEVTSLPDVLSGVITTELTSLTLQVDGAAAIPVTQVTPALPHAGPVKVSYTSTIPDLAPGEHTICVTANGREDGRDVSATDCHTVTLRQAVLTVEPLVGPPGLVVSAVGTDFPPGARVRLAWSVGLSETPGEVTVGADGRFEAQILIFHKDQVGLRELTAVPVTGPPFANVESQQFLVVPRSLQPPFSEGRVGRR